MATGPDPNPVYCPPWLGGRLLPQKKNKKTLMNKILQFQNLGSELFPSDNNETIIVVTEEKTVTN